jgi:hypothetical protein
MRKVAFATLLLASVTYAAVKAAIAAPEAAQEDGTLYGMKRWRKPTGRSYLWLKFPGLLSCAYTVSAIFREACHPIGDIASVKGIDAALAKWRRVPNARDLKAGDVVFWKPVRGRSLDSSAQAIGTLAFPLVVIRRSTTIGGRACPRRQLLRGHALHSRMVAGRLLERWHLRTWRCRCRRREFRSNIKDRLGRRPRC